MTVPETSLRYPLHQATLDNGLRVIVNPDHSAPVVAVNLWYDVGSRDETPGRTGLAHLFEHLMFQGSAGVASGEHLALMQSVGGSVNATTWFDRTNYFETVPTGALDLALWLEADRLATLRESLTQANLDNQRDVVKEEKRQRYDNVPYGDVVDHLSRLGFGAGHPYGHPTIGSMADLDAATLDDVRAFFAGHYVPNRAVLTLVGDIEPEDGVARARRFFGGIPAGEPVARSFAELPPLPDPPRVDVAAAVPADAAYLIWRLPARGGRRFDAADIALAVLGDGQTSRLHRRLVRDELIAEGSGASAMGLIGGNSLGFAYARALPGVGADALEAALRHEVELLVAHGVTEAELERVRAQFEREWLTELAGFAGRADLFGTYATLQGDPNLVNTRVAEYCSIGADEVARAAAEWLRGDQAAVLSYRRASKEEPA